MLVGGCTAYQQPGIVGDVPAPGEPNILPLPAHTPVAVPGVASCDVLPQEQPSDTPGIDRLPPFRLPCLTSGPDIDLSMLRGRPVLVNLWATWCGPCRDEMALLQSNYERYGAEVQFLGVNTRDAAVPAARFLSEVNVAYPQVVDVEGRLLDHLRIPGLPVTVVLDADGRIAGKHIGELKQESLDDLLTKVRAGT